MQLRDYQHEALSKINTAFTNGVHKQVIVLATGLGKTIIFSHLISERVKKTGKKALILAHREELLLQAKEKLEKVNPELRIGIEQAEQKADHSHDDVVIASVASIGRGGSERLKQFQTWEYGTIIIDEAHHASASSYQHVLEHFGVLKNKHDWNKQILLLGVTATPKRTDNQGIEQIFDEVTFEYNIVSGIQNKWLSPIKAYRVDTPSQLDSVQTTTGDFNIHELEKQVNTPERNALIVNTYLEMAEGRQALVFAVDVEHTQELYNEFKRAGIAAAYVTGATPKNERSDKLAAFAHKEIRVMVNAMVLTEGYDNASIEYVLMTRPTQSGILYQQMIGRGTRLHPGKDALTIIDFVDNTSKHSLKTAATLLGLDGTVDFQGQDILEAKTQLDKLLEKRPFINLDTLHVDHIEKLLTEVDLLEEREKARQNEQYTWHKYGEGLRMRHSKTTYYLVEQSLTGQYILSEYFSLVQVKKQVGVFTTQSEAIRRADTLAAERFSESISPQPQKSVSAPWEQDLPSEAQIALLRELGVDEQTILFLNKGEASRLISERKRSRR